MRTGLWAMALFFTATGMVQGRTIYVDSRVGYNGYNGTSAEPINAHVGPVKTLSRAMQLICPGDSLVLVDNGTPYYGELTFFGGKFSGTASEPFRLIGNGAVISGAKPIAHDSWVEMGNDLWKLTPYRKGWYQLVEDGEAVPRVELPWAPGQLPNLPVGSWGAYRGSIYYKSHPQDEPRGHRFELAEKETGLTLLDVQNVVISDVTFRHFRVDGINLHDRCENVTLNNVSCLENGRAGIVVGGTSEVDITDCRLEGNVKASLLITELGEATVTGTEYDREPMLAKP